MKGRQLGREAARAKGEKKDQGAQMNRRGKQPTKNHMNPPEELGRVECFPQGENCAGNRKVGGPPRGTGGGEST